MKHPNYVMAKIHMRVSNKCWNWSRRGCVWRTEAFPQFIYPGEAAYGLECIAKCFVALFQALLSSTKIPYPSSPPDPMSIWLYLCPVYLDSRLQNSPEVVLSSSHILWSAYLSWSPLILPLISATPRLSLTYLLQFLSRRLPLLYRIMSLFTSFTVCPRLFLTSLDLEQCWPHNCSIRFSLQFHGYLFVAMNLFGVLPFWPISSNVSNWLTLNIAITNQLALLYLFFYHDR